MGGYRIGENKYIIYYNFDNVSFYQSPLLFSKAAPFKPFTGQHFRPMPKVSVGVSKTNVAILAQAKMAPLVFSLKIFPHHPPFKAFRR